MFGIPILWITKQYIIQNIHTNVLTAKFGKTVNIWPCMFLEGLKCLNKELYHTIQQYHHHHHLNYSSRQDICKKNQENLDNIKKKEAIDR